ncbi:hypothetical protein VPARA_08970 [Variovorax paradoxus]|uniref:Uncharacterized protein n=1 Tax=Variovorax paradoxus TaxID=34073 RepID=A0A0H2M725_VARPD|nr:hypothetical protein VPARA_08970 [Variovorax paradoxus]
MVFRVEGADGAVFLPPVTRLHTGAVNRVYKLTLKKTEG